MVLEPEKKEEKNDKKVRIKGGLGWLGGQEQDMSSLALYCCVYMIFSLYSVEYYVILKINL